MYYFVAKLWLIICFSVEYHVKGVWIALVTSFPKTTLILPKHNILYKYNLMYTGIYQSYLVNQQYSRDMLAIG